jgi:hypothetical protein
MRKLAALAVSLTYFVFVILGSASAYSKTLDLLIVGLGFSFLVVLSILLLWSRVGGGPGRESLYRKWRSWITDSHPAFS